MASKSIANDTINSKIKAPLNDTREKATTYGLETATKFSKLGAVVDPLSKAVKNTASSIDRFVVGAIKIQGNHPTPPSGDTAAELAKSTRKHSDINPESLISSHKETNHKAGK